MCFVFLALRLSPLGDISGRVGHPVEFVEDWERQSEGDEIVAPDPLVLDVVLQGELGDLRAEGVRKFHWAPDGLLSCNISHLDLRLVILK